MRYWISWHQPTEDHRPLTDPPQPNVLGWWCSGYDADETAILCAVVVAASEGQAHAAIKVSWPEAERWRFCESCADDWRPRDRFPLKPWMKERLGCYGETYFPSDHLQERSMLNIRDYTVFDFETTGLDPQECRVIQVGVCVVADGRCVKRREWLVNPGCEVPAEVAAIHGITTEAIRAAGKTPAESMNRLEKYLSASPYVLGHNCHRFDVFFLNAERLRLGRKLLDCEGYIDTAALYKGHRLGMARQKGETFGAYARRVLGVKAYGLKYKLELLAEKYSLDVGDGQAHSGGQDAFVTHLLFEALKQKSHFS